MSLAGRKGFNYALYAVLLSALLMFLVWPIVMTLQGGFFDAQDHFTLKYFVSVFSDPVWMRGLGNSLWIALATTIVCVTVTLPLAVLSVRYDFFGKTWLNSLMLVPLILPPFVGAIGMRSLLGRYGAINSLLSHLGFFAPGEPGLDFLGGIMPGGGGRIVGIILMEVLHLYPILYLNISAALANLDPALDEAARNMGASKRKRFFSITLPLIVPGIFAGATIIFIWSFTELGTPLMFEFYDVTAVQIFWSIQEIQTNPRAYALVAVMLAMAVGLYLLGKFVLGRRGYAMQSKASIANIVPRLTGWRSLITAAPFVLIITLALLPHLGVILTSFAAPGSWYQSVLPGQWTTDHYRDALSHPMAMLSIRNSLIYSLAAMVLAVLAGLAISYLTVRARIKGSTLLDSLAMLPLAVPGLVMAFGYVAMSLAWPFPQLAEFFSGIGWNQVASLCQITGSSPNPLVFLVIAYAVRRLPYVVRSASVGLEQTSEQLEEAAQNLGATPLQTMRKITMPLIAANLIAGGILAFSLAMLEVSDSLILAQKQNHFPITKAIFELYNRLGDGQAIASAMGVWGMVLLTITLIGAGVMMGRKMGAIFRA